MWLFSHIIQQNADLYIHADLLQKWHYNLSTKNNRKSCPLDMEYRPNFGKVWKPLPVDDEFLLDELIIRSKILCSKHMKQSMVF